MALSRRRRRKLKKKVIRNQERKRVFKDRISTAKAEGSYIPDDYQKLDADRSKPKNLRQKFRKTRTNKKRQKGMFNALERIDPDSGRVERQTELTHAEIRRDNIDARKEENRELFDRQKATNLFGRSRYGLIAGDDKLKSGATQQEREKVLGNLNDALRIRPAGVDPTRKVTKKSTQLAQAFASLEGQLKGATPGKGLDNQAIRGEVARLREIAESMGNRRLAGQMDEYLRQETSNTNLKDGGEYGRALMAVRDVQAHVRDAVNVDYVLQETGAEAFGAALPPGIHVNPQTNELYRYKTAQDFKDEQAASQRRLQERIDSDYEPGSRRFGNAWLERMEDTVEEQKLGQAQALADMEEIWSDLDADGMPWWATIGFK